MGIAQFKGINTPPVLPSIPLTLNASTWSSFILSGVVKVSYLEIPIATMSDLSTLFIDMFSPQTPIAQTLLFYVYLYDKIGPKKKQVCSSPQITVGPGVVLNGRFTFTNSSGAFATSQYATDQVSQNLQNNAPGLYTTVETGLPSYLTVATAETNMPPLSKKASMFIVYRQSIGADEFIDFNVNISGNNN